MTNLPEPARPREMAVRPGMLRAAVSPSAAALVAAGAVIGVLVFHTWVVAVVLALAGWSARMAAAALASRRREEAGRPRPAGIDPWSVPEPWRPLLQQLAGAQTRFDQVVSEWPPGPLRERLLSLQPEVWSDVAGLASMARRGAAMTGWTGATSQAGRPTAEGLSAELKLIAAERASGGPEAAGDLDRREAAVAAQLRAVRQSEQAAAGLLDRLRAAVAGLDARVTGLLALGGETGGADAVFSSLEQLGDEVAALRAAVSETAGSPPEPTTP